MNTSLVPALALSALAAFAAQDGPEQRKFEVASVKQTDRCEFKNSIDPGFVTLNGVPLKVVLTEAFKVKADQIEGPAWLDSDCFQIAAKMPAGATKDDLPALLQALLTERFKMAVRMESRSRPGYALVVDKDGPKLKESVAGSNFMGGGRATLFVGAGPGYSAFKAQWTTASLARGIGLKLNAPVQDLTGLTGKYDIDISWAPDRTIEPAGFTAATYIAEHPGAPEQVLPGTPVPADDLFGVLRRKLGLKLEPRKQDVAFVVIERIERVPTGN